MSVYKKLQQARVLLQAKEMKKSGHNKFAGYSYFELGDFLPSITSIFNELGLCSVVSFDKELATLRIVDIEDGKEVVFTSPMADAMLKGCHPIQNLGAVETYSRRYLFVTALEIVEHDALDSAEPLKPSAKHVELVESKKSIAQDHFDKLDKEEQEFLRQQAVEITTADDLLAAYEDVKKSLDAEEQLALWSLLPSPIRTRIKKEGAQKQAA